MGHGQGALGNAEDIAFAGDIAVVDAVFKCSAGTDAGDIAGLARVNGQIGRNVLIGTGVANAGEIVIPAAVCLDLAIHGQVVDAAAGGDEDAPAKARGDLGGLLHGNVHIVDLVVIAVEVAGPSVIAPGLDLTVGPIHGGADGDIGVVDGGHVDVGHEAKIEGLLRLAADLIGADGVIHQVSKFLQFRGIMDQEVAVRCLGQVCLLGKLHGNVPVGTGAALHGELDVSHLAGFAAIPILGDLVAAVILLFNAGAGTGIVGIHRQLKGIVLTHPVEAGLVHLRRQSDALVERHEDLWRPGGHICGNHHTALLDGDVGQVRGRGSCRGAGRGREDSAGDALGRYVDFGCAHTHKGHQTVLVHLGNTLVVRGPLDILEDRGFIPRRRLQLHRRVLGVIAIQIYAGRAVARGVLDGKVILPYIRPLNGQLEALRHISAGRGNGRSAQALSRDVAPGRAVVHIRLDLGDIVVLIDPGDGRVRALIRIEFYADAPVIVPGRRKIVQRQRVLILFICGGRSEELDVSDLRLCGHAGDGDGAGGEGYVGNIRSRLTIFV